VEAKELLDGLRNSFNVYLSVKETEAVTRYLDADGSGDVDLQEFTQKVNLGELMEKANDYTISKSSFV